MADLTIHELQNEATAPANDDYAVLDGATAGTRKITPANLATWVLGKISSLATTITSFASGDFIVVSNTTDGSRKMSKDTLLELTAQNALAGNVAPEFVPNSTTTVAGYPYVYNGSLYVAKEAYQGAWDASKFSVSSVKYFIDHLFNISRQIAGYKDVLTGTGQTTPGIVGEKMVAINGATYSIIPSRNTWGSSYGSNVTIFAVQKIYADDTTSDAVYYLKKDEIPPVITFTLNDANAKYLRIFYRGNASEVVTFTWNPCSQNELFNSAILYTKNAISLLAGHKDSLTGTGQTTPGIIGEKMVAVNNATYSIIPSARSWGSSYGNNVTVFAVQKIYADGTTANAVEFEKRDQIPPIISFILNDANAKYLRIFYRGNADETVTFTWNLCSQGDAFNAARLALKNFSETLTGTIASGGALTGANGSLVPAVSGFTYSVMPSKTKWKTDNISSAATAIFDIVKVYADGTTAVDVEYKKSDYIPEVVHYTCTDESAKWLRVFMRADSGEEVSFTWNTDVFSSVPADHRQMTSYCRSVNHRGYNTIAPENTIPAFILSKKMGFDTIELDVRTTLDGKFVCCHDATVDRTSDGTGAVADMTLAELKELDFGSWKSAVYAGTKIPTFEEALICCRNIGLNVYIDLAAVADVLDLVKLVNHYGLKERATFITDTLSHMQNLQTSRPGQYRIGYICGTVTQTIKDNIVALDAGLGNVFLDIQRNSLTDAVLDDMKSLGIPVEIWTENSIINTRALSQGVSGMTSDEVIFGKIKYNQEIRNS